MKQFLLRIKVSLIFAFLLNITNDVAGQRPRVLMCKGNTWQLCDTGQWPTVYDSIDIVKIYIGEIRPDADIEQVKCFIQKMKSKGIKIAFEIGGLLDWHADKGDQAAQYSFQQEWDKLRQFIAPVSQRGVGGYIDILELDGPIRRMLFPNDVKANHHTLQSAVQELTKVINLWQDSLSGSEINVMVNFPVWGWKGGPAYFAVKGYPDGYGDYYDALNEMFRQFDSTGVRPSGITIDNPYDYAIGTAQTNQAQLITGIDWVARILELEHLIKAQEMKMNLVFNSNQGGYTGNDVFYYQTLEYIDLYLQRGGKPDGYWIQSWYKHPQEWLPETKPYTMTYLLLHVLNKINGYHTNIINTALNGVRVSCYPNPFSKGFKMEIMNQVLSQDEFTYTVYDIMGKVVKHTTGMLEAGSNLYVIGMEDQAPGVYFLHYTAGDEAAAIQLLKL